MKIVNAECQPIRARQRLAEREVLPEGLLRGGWKEVVRGNHPREATARERIDERRRLPAALKLLCSEVDRLNVYRSIIADREACRFDHDLAPGAADDLVDLRPDGRVLGGRRAPDRALGEVRRAETVWP